MKFFFHADDLGATPGVSRIILDAWEAGLIGGFSILANGLGVGLVTESLARHRELDARIAVHLNLSDGRSSLPSKEVPGLVDRTGRLKYGFLGVFLRLALSHPSTRQRLLREIECEWREQIHRTKSICGGRRIQAIDGHIHVHMIPFLFPIASRLAVEEEIPEIRIPWEPWSLSLRPERLLSVQVFANYMKWALMRLLAYPALRCRKRHDIGGPAAFIGLIDAGRNTMRAVLSSLERMSERGIDSCEILFHIGGAPEEEVREWNPLAPTFRFLTSRGRRREYDELVKLRRHLREREARLAPRSGRSRGRCPDPGEKAH